MREKLVLGSKEFKSKTAAAKYIRKLMEGYSHNKHLIGEDFRLVLDLLKRFRNADQKIGPGVQDIILQTGIGTDRYFLIMRLDGSWAKSGYKRRSFS